MISTIDWNPILLAFIAFLGTTVTAFIGYLTIKLAKVGKTVDTIHALTNSAMGAQKKTLAEVTAAKYAITKDPLDKGAADTAMAEYLIHVGQQQKADTVA